MAIGDFAKSRNLLTRNRSAKRDAVRRVLLETLEGRQLMAVGPTLVGVQPNEGDLLENGEVLNVSPKELVFRFDDAVGIDPQSLSGIRVIRAGADGLFERAAVVSDLGSNGATLVEFYAREAGESGNGLAVRFSKVSRNDSRLPKVTVLGRVVNVELNINPQLQTRVQDLLQALPASGGAPVYALRLRGSDTLNIGTSTDATADYVLAGANTAKASTDFGIGNNVSVQFLARESGNAGVGINILVTARDRGGAGNPLVTVTGKTINVEINSNARFPTTVQEFVNAINSADSISSSLVEAKLVSGSGAIRLGTQPITYSPIALTGVSDIEVVPGFIGLGPTGREVILRFAERLPQDQYRLEIVGHGLRALRNTAGQTFNGGASQSVAFSLALGARIESVVPQPVSRNASGGLVQQRNQIDLYFNDDSLIDMNSIASINGTPLANFQQLRTPFFIQSGDIITLKSGATLNPTALDFDFYQLFYTAETLDSRDDMQFPPSAVRYYPESQRINLIYARPLEELQNPGGGPTLPITDLRLRVGTNEVRPLDPVIIDGIATEPGDHFAGSLNLNGSWSPGAGGSQSVLINSRIRNTSPFLLDFPGGSDEPGNRRNRYQDNLRLGADALDGTSVINYNFQGNLGNSGSTTLLNAITEQQKQRVREVFSLYERYLGVRFVETSSTGLTVAVGDTRAVAPFEDIAGSGIPGVVTLNSQGVTYYEAGTLLNGQLGAVLDIQDFSNATLNEFGGPFQRAAMQAIGRMLGLGLADEVEGFTIQAFNSAFVPGVGSDITLPGDVDIVHGQFLYRPDSTDIDLYQFTLPVAGQISVEAFAERMSRASLLDTSIRLYRQVDGGWNEIAFNDDYYSSDSFIQLDLGPGNYIVGVSASGNNTYDPVIGNTGIGGRSQGDYQLRMDFRPPSQGVLRDSSGQAVDANSNGESGGVFNFWFRPAGPANTKFVDKATTTPGAGTLTAPYSNISTAIQAAQPGDVIRIVGNGGADGSMATVRDNLAYEIGFNALGQPLPDGATFDVPKNVSVIIDAGAILKMRRSRIGVGSTSASVDRSGGSLLVLGTPKLLSQTGAVVKDASGVPVVGSVVFTSANDVNIGQSANSAVVGINPVAGDWGGIDFRTRVDNADATRSNNESQGQFLNWIAHADIRYGGGQVVIDGLSQIVTPVQMIDARPTVGNSTITRSADAALSATPNSFLESNFNSPAEQAPAATPFSVDYDRVGPALYFNRIVDNSINGLQVRIRTATGTQLESMTISGRFDDTDVVHFLPENLVIAGTPGGATLINEAPASAAVILQSVAGGTLPTGTYNYRFTRVVNGVESAPSEPTGSAFIFGFFGATNRALSLTNLPGGVTRVYRSSPTGEGPYVEVPFTPNATTFIDNGTTLANQLAGDLERYRSRLDGRLAIDAGTIVKSQGSRIEVAMGGQLIAEGDVGNPVVLTSYLDTRYGAGGTFNTTSIINSTARPGDWGGVYVGHTSSASLDQSVIAFGGGTTRIEGGFSDFNAVEVHQGDLRLTNSTLESNANGATTSSDPDRAGRGDNTSGTIFVRGSQPVIAGNTIQNNQGAALSANVNSLNHQIVADLGRSRGPIGRFNSLTNRGPLITQNQLAGNGINGMVVRGGIMTTEGIWDDTDMVHVVLDEIVVSDHNHYGGLRLTSTPGQSLVVKLSGDNAGFTARGVPIDNANRIGGSVQIIGLPNYPVVLTSLQDSTVSAGFAPDLVQQNPGTPPAAGDWRSIRLDAQSNDRNVATIREFEGTDSFTINSNNGTGSAQLLGSLAANEKSGDENNRLGFHVMGSIATPSDMDVYSFLGIGGSEVWLDIDGTDNSLDTVIELVDADGRALALSDNSLAEEANPALLYRSPDMGVFSVNPLRKSPVELTFSSASGAPKDLYSTNPADAGLRVVLPGAVGASNLYHIRVRSSNLRQGDPASKLLDPAQLTAGLTKGSYTLQVRLNEVDEVPGSSISYADIRFATNGLELRGVPGNSPLLGETGEVETIAGQNDTFNSAQYLGNLLATNRQSLSLAGNIQSFTDVDWFSFDIAHQRITPLGLREYFATVLDVDYANGIGRPDTSVYLFDAAGNLILSGLSSGLTDDQAVVSGAGNADLSRGSAGFLDPFVGSYELAAGRYFVAITNSQMVPEVLTTYTDPNSSSPFIRFQPIDSLALIADDHVESQGGSNAFDFLNTPAPLFDPVTSVVPFDLSDMVLYVSQTVASERTNIYLVNPFTGEIRNQLSRGNFDVQDIAMRTNSTLQAFDRTFRTPSNADRDTLLDYITIDTGTGAFTASGATYETFNVDPSTAPPTAVASNDGWNPEALTFANLGNVERGFMVANRPTPFGTDPAYFDPAGDGFAGSQIQVNTTVNVNNVGLTRPGVTQFTNVVFEFNPDNGTAVSNINDPGARKQNLAPALGPGTDIFERGRIETFTLDGAGNRVLRSTQMLAREVTQSAGSNVVRLIQDQNTFTLIDSAGFRTRFEFDLGPEVQILDHTRVRDGMQFTIDGVVYEFEIIGQAAGVAPGATAVPLSATATVRQFVDAIASVLPNNISVGYEAGRMNFSGATNGSFTQLVFNGVLTSFNTTGTVTGGNVPIRVLASDSAETVAARIVQTVNALSIPGLSASANGSAIQFFGVEIEDQGPMLISGIAPGGIIRGATMVGNTMFAVSDAGGLYSVPSFQLTNYGGTRNIGSYVTTSAELRGIEFSALSVGPQLVLGGALSQILFGLDTAGNLHAFDTAGRLQPVFANGATQMATGLVGASGLAFSTLNRNLWAETNLRSGDPGHGIEATRNNTRIRTTGGSSLYFGVDNPGAANHRTYNFPGGAAGAMESRAFSLAGISQGDQPTLYFNYFLETEAAASDLPIANNANDYMRDAFRVYVSGEDGQWVLTATNNDPVQAGSNSSSLDDEFDPLVAGAVAVQPLFDNTGNWRQARIPLSQFAGQENVRIRIEFSSAGGFGYGQVGGKGPEIRTISGSRLVDGQQLSVRTTGGFGTPSQTFEIEMGPTLSMPSGMGVNEGDFVMIEGTKYLFTLGATVPAPDVAVTFDKLMTAEQIAQALQTAIANNPPVISTVSGLAYTTETNDSISTAETSGITGNSVRLIGTGVIGDNPGLANPSQDIDLVRMELDRDSTVAVKITAAIVGSPLDSFLRVFDSEGRVLAQNDNSPGSTDSALTFIAPKSGTYYVGVSSAGNSTYSASVPGTAATGTSTGSYTLEIEVQRNLDTILVGNRLQLEGVSQVQLSPGSNIRQQGNLGAGGIPVFLRIDMTAQEVATEMQRALAEFYANNAIGVYPIRGGDTISVTGLDVVDAGPFGLTTTFVGDQFNAFNTGSNFNGQTPNAAFPGSLQSRANNFEGAYVDDFIIGLAGRGELVVGVTNANTAFVRDPQLALTNPDRTNGEILLGPYQLEIRGGEEYGIPSLPGFPTTIDLDRTIDARRSEGVTIQMNDSIALVAGTTFTVTDGTRAVTIELDDVLDGIDVQPGNVAFPFNTAVIDPVTGGSTAESAGILAARFRDLINSLVTRQQLQGIAATLDNVDRVGSSSRSVVIVGGDAQVPASFGTRFTSTFEGGSNRERLQGQVVINSVRVSNAENFGVAVTAAPRDPLTGASQNGTPRNTVTINDERLVPGAAIINSEFVSNLQGGISIVGDAGGANLPTASVPFVRLVNNTVLGGSVSTTSNVSPVIFNGTVFNTGSLAFADQAVSFTVGSPAPLAGLATAASAIGLPNYTGNGEPLAGEGVVSLGRGGVLTLQFTDNFLTGSNNSNPDLAIFEVGDSEEVLVEVSADGVNWSAVGRASGATPTIDLDAFGFNVNSRLSFVRLTDVVSQGSLTGDSVGADIDAVGAISSVPIDQYTPGGLGISVSSNATATLLNNVLVNNVTGIAVDSTSSSTVVGGTVFQFNTNNVAGAATVGQFPLILSNNLPMFVSPGGRNLYPALASRLIDSSIDSLADRASLVAVKNSLGMAASPIQSPRFDINGQLRVDDPSVETPSGLGESVFKDRGAQERADFVGPSVVMLNPVDNDLAGLDKSLDPTIVELVGTTPQYFDIRLIDGVEPSDPSRGSGIDHSSVSSASILVFRNNQPLVEGLDYRFGYDATSGVIRLQPLAGVWQGQSAYTIRFINTSESAIVAKSGSEYVDGDQISIMDSRNSLTKFEIDLGYLVSLPVANGNAALTDGTVFSIDDGSRRIIFELDSNSSVAAGNSPVVLPSDILSSATAAIKSAIDASGLQVTVSIVGDGRLQIQGSSSVAFDARSSGLTVTGRSGVQGIFGLRIPLVAGIPQGINDGQTFTINRGSGPVNFEIDTNGSVIAGNVPVRFATTATAAEIGAALVSAIDGAGLGLSPTYDGNGVVRLGGDSNTRLILGQSGLTQVGVAGEPASIPVNLPATATATEAAALIRQAIEAQNLPGVIISFGPRLIIGGATAVSGVGAGTIGTIRDLAGNTIKPNQVNGSTQLTILLGDGFDYGDAPAPWISTAIDNGPRHQVISGLSIGNTVTADVDARLPDGDSDNLASFSIFAGFASSRQIAVTNTTGRTGYLQMWIDYNADGVFATNELITPASGRAITGSDNPTLFFDVPATAVAGDSYARVRFSTDQNSILEPTGSSPDGEVEDIRVNIRSNPFTNGAWNLDVSRDGSVTPRDALLVIDWLNDVSKPRVLQLADATFAPPFIDVNGDGRVTPGDALQVIDYLNNRPAFGEGESNSSNGSSGYTQETVLANNWVPSLFSQSNAARVGGTSPAPVVDALIGLAEAYDTPAVAWQSVSDHDTVWAEIGAEEEEDAGTGLLIEDLLDDLWV